MELGEKSTSILAKYFTHILVILTLILVYYAFSSEQKLKGDLVLRGDTTFCVVTDPAPIVRVRYKANGTEYESGTIETKVRSYREGESFKLVYDVEDPENYEVLFWLPIIEESQFVRTVAYEIRTEMFNSRFITFDFIVGGKKYSRGQKLPPNYDSKNVKDDFEVIYNKSNPKIAYMVIPD